MCVIWRKVLSVYASPQPQHIHSNISTPTYVRNVGVDMLEWICWG